ncbi:MAG: hypothetical protein II951_08795 [Bacteroidales bacterium]|nr:hypothetical protein [Bacteroidales bacterium]
MSEEKMTWKETFAMVVVIVSAVALTGAFWYFLNNVPGWVGFLTLLVFYGVGGYGMMITIPRAVSERNDPNSPFYDAPPTEEEIAEMEKGKKGTKGKKWEKWEEGRDRKKGDEVGRGER